MGYIPRPDAEFNKWLLDNASYTDTNHLVLGITLAQNKAYQALKNKWFIDYTDCSAKELKYNTAVQKKLSARLAAEGMVRELTNIIQANHVVTNEQKAALGITVRKETKTPVPVPTTRPMAKVDNKIRLEHFMHFFDEMTTTSKAKPYGVRGCEIWCKIGGEAPKNACELHYLATDTATPYLAHFESEDCGKTVFYWLRWVNTRNEPGPWSETISVTISE